MSARSNALQMRPVVWALRALTLLAFLYFIYQAALALVAWVNRPRLTELMSMDPLAGRLAVEVQPAEIGEAARAVRYTGTLVPNFESPLLARVEGWVRELSIDEGSRVQEGQIVATLDREELEARLAAREAETRFWEAEFSRIDELFARGSLPAARHQDVLQRRDAAREAEQAARTLLDYTTLRAPITGLVTRRHVDPGALVKPGTAIATIADVTRMRLQVNVAQEHASGVTRGTPVRVQVPALSSSSDSSDPGDEALEGVVATVFPVSDFRTRTTTVEILVPNRHRKILPGLYAEAELVLETRPDAVLVPEGAVVSVEGEPSVFVTSWETMKAERRAVALGIAGRGKVQVLSGIQPADLVIVRGQRALVDGQEIIIRAP